MPLKILNRKGIVNYLPTTKPAGVTADPLFVFQFKPDADWLTDRTGNGYDASIVTGAFEFKVDPETGLIGLYFDSAQDHELILPDSEALRVARVDGGGGDASLTLEAIVRQESPGIILGCDGSGEVLENNYLWQLGPAWDDSGVLKHYAFTEDGTGDNITVSSNAVVRLDVLHYLGLTISSDGLTWKYYLNGQYIGQGIAARYATKASTGNLQRVRIGRQESDTNDFKGLICSLRATAETFPESAFVDTWNNIQSEAYPIPDYLRGDDFAEVEDRISLPPQTGRKSFSTGLNQGLRLPGPTQQSLGSTGPFDEVSVDDEVQRLSSGSRDLHGVEPAAGNIIVGTDTLPEKGPTQGVALDDLVTYLAGIAPDYRMDTNDFNGHPHFIGERVVKAFIYDAQAEAGLWTTPTDPSFTGYGKDGKYYINGVLQGTNAPWYDEVESDDRGPTKPFPNKILGCLTRMTLAETTKEVVLFDLDNFPTSLDMWIRFKVNGGNDPFFALGNENRQVLDIAMANGVLVAGTKSGAAYGCMHVFDFRGVGQDCGFMVRSNDDWIAAPGKTIVDRNTTDFWTTTGTPNLRIEPEDIYSVAARLRNGNLWIACGGEDPGPDLFRLPNISAVPDKRVQPTGELGDVNIGDVRKVVFDDDDHWWFSINNRLIRVLPVDYEEGSVTVNTSVPSRRRAAARDWIDLPYPVLSMAAVGEFLFVATEVGVYRLHRGTFDLSLAYTISGYGGGGRFNTPPDGEVIPGGDPEVQAVAGVALSLSSYLFVATRTGVVAIRLHDNFAIDSREHPDLYERGAHFNVAVID